MTITAKVILDSVNPLGCRLTTFELRFPHYIHKEILTHRTFSRNATSNRAIPTKRLIRNVLADEIVPDFAVNQAGMQPGRRLTGWRRSLATWVWRGMTRVACAASWALGKLGVHKQWANRWLEPAQHSVMIVSSTSWDNFFEQRDHIDAQLEIAILAREIRRALVASVPTILKVGEWHAPYLLPEDYLELTDAELLDVSVARCARVSYLNHAGRRDPKEDLELCYHLAGVSRSGPRHLSPFEHVARCESDSDRRGNFHGWTQRRLLLEQD